MRFIKLKPIFSKEDIERIQNTVAKAEQGTSAEIVVVVSPASDPYWEITFLFALLGWILSSVTVYLLHHDFFGFHWGVGKHYHLSEILLWQSFGIALGLTLIQIPFLQRKCVPKKTQASKVHQRAMGEMIQTGLVETKNRTGILIYLSLLEHRVEILPDKGVKDQVPSSYWQEQMKNLVTGFQEGSPTQGLCEAITQIGQMLSKNFPPDPNNPNELPDTIRMR